MARERRLGIEFIGSGFITRLHLQGLVAARDVEIPGLWSPTQGIESFSPKVARRAWNPWGKSS